MRRILILAAITFAGLAARLATADWGGLSGDEANGVAIALAPGWGDLWARLKEDGNPPLFYLLLRLAVFLLGDADFALRILAILVSAAIVPATFFIVGPVFGAPTAWQAALLVAFCPPLVRWGTMVRMYGILPLLSTASIFAGMRILAGERAPAWRVFHLAGTAALFYCHHWGFIVAAGQVLAGLAGWLGGRIAGRSVLALFLSLAGALAVYSLWLPTLLYVLAHNESPWATAPALSHLVIETPPEMLVGRLLLRDTWQELAIIACDLIAALAICLAPAAASRLCATKPEGKTPEDKAPEEKAAEEKAPEEKAAEEKAAEEKAAEEKAAEEKAPEEKAAEEKAAEEKAPEEKAAEEKAAEEKAAEEKATVSAAGQGGRPAWLLAATIIGGLAVAVALSSIKPGWRDRYLVCFTPGMLVLYAVFITGAVSALYRGLAPGRLPGFLRPVLPLLVLLPLWLPQLVWLKQMPESSAWAISEKIKAEARAEKDLIVVSWQASAPAISRTLPEKFRMVCFPDIERVKIIKWDGIDERLRDEGRLLLLLDRIAAVLADGGRIWLVDSSHSTGPAPPPGASAGLRGLHFNAAEQARMDQIRSWLLLNGEKQSLSLWAPGRDISLELSVWGMRSGRAGRDDTGRDDAGRDDTDKTGSDDGDERGPLPGAVGP